MVFTGVCVAVVVVLSAPCAHAWLSLGLDLKLAHVTARSSGCPPRLAAPRPAATRCQSFGTASSSEVGVADDSDTAVAFSAWLQPAGIQSRLALANFGELRGTMTACPVPRGEAVLSFPRSITMDLRTAEECPCPELVDPLFWESAPWYLQLALWLVAEERKGDSSEWAPYIRSLPQHVDTPFYWTKEQLGLLGYSPLIDRVNQQKDEFAALLEAARPHLQADVTDRLEWGMFIALSRAVESPNRVATSQLLSETQKEMAQNANNFMTMLKRNVIAATGGEAGPAERKRERACKALAPMWDSCNHEPRSSTRFSYDPVSDGFVLVAGRDFEAREQCLISYGQFGNDHLMQYYGFLCEGNPDDSFELSTFNSWLLNACRHPRGTDAEQRLMRVHQAGLMTSLAAAQLSYRFRAGAWVDEPTLQGLRAFTASEAELDSLTPDGFARALSLECEVAALEVLLAHLQEVEAEWAAAASSEEAVRERGAVGQLVLRFRSEKRTLLASAVADLRGKTARLARMAPRQQ